MVGELVGRWMAWPVGGCVVWYVGECFRAVGGGRRLVAHRFSNL